MKNTSFFGKTRAAALAALLCVFALAGCGDTDDDSVTSGGGGTKRIAVTFVSASHIDFAADDSNTSARISLGFNRDIPGLGASDVTAKWENGDAIAVSSLDIDPYGGAYTLTLDGITASGTITVSVNQTGYAFKPGFKTVEVIKVVAPNNPSIKAKFGITTTDITSVKDSFNALHGFIEGGGLASMSDVIQLGDWIDLEGGLIVAEYAGHGGINIATNSALTSDQFPILRDQIDLPDPVPGYRDSTLRLIVVGINSFQDGGSDGNSEYRYQGIDEPPDHVVFQFQNLPVTRRMNATTTWPYSGYPVSEMRRYLTPVGNDANSGRFLAGLKNAGVPMGVLWAPERRLFSETDIIGYIGVIYGYGSPSVIDLLWLPTVREMHGPAYMALHSYIAGGTARDQAWLEYYTGNDQRRKYLDNKKMFWYWESTGGYPSFSTCNDFNIELMASHHFEPDTAGGVAPAFCVQ
jgi:hypothetical protein